LFDDTFQIPIAISKVCVRLEMCVVEPSLRKPQVVLLN